jgi:hypothetical protein
VNLSAAACVQSHVMLPSRSYRFPISSPSQHLRATQLRRPDAIVWLGTVAIATVLFLIFFVL